MFAVTRSTTRAATWKDEGLYPVVADVTDPNEFDSLPAADTVLFAVGHDRTAGPSIFDAYAGGLRNVLDAPPPTKRARVIYASSTGVYGPAGGDWVDEQTPPHPPARRRQKPRSWPRKSSAATPAERAETALRLGGLYGPGRVPHLDKMKAGRADRRPPAKAGSTSSTSKTPPASSPSRPRRPTRRPSTTSPTAPRSCEPTTTAKPPASSAPPPPTFCPPAALLPRRKSAPPPTRRISNGLLMRELAPALTYPTYREGLAAVLGG